MTKESNSFVKSTKLSLGKKTIPNLSRANMSKKIGGEMSLSYCIPTHCCGKTHNGNTCPGHNTCYIC